MILTLDPSLNAFGWAIIDEKTNIVHNCGCIVYPASKKTNISSMKDKVIGKYNQDTLVLTSIFKKLDDIIKTNKVAAIYTEVAIGSQSSRAAEALSMVKGLTISLAATNKLVIYPVSPSKIKEVLAFDRNATKEEIYAKVVEKFPTLKNFRPDLMTKVAKYGITDAISVFQATLK